MPGKRETLTNDQRKFVDEYLVDLNATQAYRRVFPQASYGTAATEASKLLKKPHIKAEVEAALEHLRERCREDAEKTIQELGLLAFSRITDILDFSNPKKPKLKKNREIHPDAWAAVQEVAVTRQGLRVKLHSKNHALDKMMAHLGLIKEIPSLEAFLLALPGDLRDQVRRALAASVLSQANSSGTPSDSPTG